MTKAEYDKIRQEAIKSKLEAVEGDLKATDFWKTCEDYFTLEQREYFLAIINKHK